MKNIKKIQIKSFRNFILLGICGFLAIANVVMTIESSVAGISISNLQKQEKELADQKRTLQDQLVKTLSLNGLSERSTELGFIKPETAVYLSQSAPVAKLP